MQRASLLGTTAVMAVGIAIFPGAASAQTVPASQSTTSADGQVQASAADGTDVAGDAEIIVTARKREERLLEVPISMQVLSDDMLRQTGTFDLQGMKAFSGFTFIKSLGTVAAGRAFGNLTFRGLQAEAGAQFEATGALFIDGVLVSNGQSTVNTVDVERVEILKGPQNAFFGRSTFGGAVNFITKNPSSRFQGSVNASVTTRGSNDVDATIEGPLVPGKLNGRITVVTHHRAADYRASDGGALGEEQTRSITGTLYATPTEGLWLRLRGHYQKDEDSPAAIGYLPGRNSTSCAGQTFGNALDILGNAVTYSPLQPYYCGSVPSLGAVGTGVIDANTDVPAVFLNPLVSNSLGDPFLSKAPTLTHAGFEREVLRASAQAGVDLPYDANLAINVGYNRSNQVNFWDLDRSARRNYFNISPILSNDLTVDARLATNPARPIRALLGLSYFKSTYQLSQIDYQPALAAFGPAAVGPLLNLGNFNDLHAKVPAVYGSVDWDIIEQLTLSLEGRYQSDKTTAFSRAGTPFVNRTKKFLPRISVSFKPNRDTNIYATYSEGVSPLTLNTGYINAGTVTPANPALKAAAQAYIASILNGATEFSPVPTLRNYEVGAKQKLFGGKLEYAVAAFYLKWTNRISAAAVFNPATCTAAQANTIPCPLPSSGTFVTFGNDVKIKGLELSVTANPIRQLSISLYAEYKDTTIPRYYNPAVRLTLTNNVIPGGNPAVTFLNRDIGKSPDLTGSLSATYRDRAFGDWDGYVRTDINYVGKQWETDFNFARLNDYARVNLRAGIERDNLTIEAFAKNLFNDKNWENGYRLADLINTPTTFLGQGLGVSPPDKREIGLRLGYKF